MKSSELFFWLGGRMKRSYLLSLSLGVLCSILGFILVFEEGINNFVLGFCLLVLGLACFYIMFGAVKKNKIKKGKKKKR